MTTIQAPATSPVPAQSRVVVRSWKAPIAFGVLTVISAVLFVVFARDGATGFNLSTSSDLIQLPKITLPAELTGIVVTSVLLGVFLSSVILVRRGKRVSLWLIAGGALFAMVGFLTWAGAGAVIQVTGLLAGTLTLSVPLIYGALGGVISERVGVVNIAIEAQLLAGAFVSAVVATMTHNPYMGLLAAAAAGVLVSFILAAFAIKYLVEQVIVGVVINVLVLGLTGFLYSQWLQKSPELLNHPEKFDRIPIPLLSEIPVVGPALFRQTFVVYLMYVMVAAVFIGLYRTRWGLRLRSVGEHPQAADTVGIRVNPTRFWNVSLAGAIVGLGGAYLTLGAVGAFGKDMTNGAGFIALAAVIFGQWDPLKATFAALLFGFASNLQNALSVIGSPVPSEFMLMLPYVVTILAVAGFVGKSRPPAADGKPYIKE